MGNRVLRRARQGQAWNPGKGFLLKELFRDVQDGIKRSVNVDGSLSQLDNCKCGREPEASVSPGNVLAVPPVGPTPDLRSALYPDPQPTCTHIQV